MTTIQIVLIALIVFLIVGLVIFVIMNMGSSQSKKNIDLIRGGGGYEKKVDEKDLQDKRRAEIAKKLKANKEEQSGDENKQSLALRLKQAGWTMQPLQFWIFSVICSVILTFLARYFQFSPMVTIFALIIGLFGLPRFILKKAIQRRQKKFLEEFADALESVVRLLKAGMPVGEAVSMISREFEGPVGEEMSIIYDMQKIGVPLHEAATEATKRMPIPEMKMFAAGLSIQAQTGSSLSEVLLNLARVIRARFRLKRKVLALSSEAVASASIIGSLPPLVAGGLYAVNPEYLEPLFTEPTGKMMLMGSAVWMSMGVLIMKQMINFKI
ncbi:MAG: type II secretion protein F [Alphaproteobacteria bacterium]|nr:type II secretion protein F [Alphaproteobacteria bacterium]